MFPAESVAVAVITPSGNGSVGAVAKFACPRPVRGDAQRLERMPAPRRSRSPSQRRARVEIDRVVLIRRRVQLARERPVDHDLEDREVLEPVRARVAVEIGRQIVRSDIGGAEVDAEIVDSERCVVRVDRVAADAVAEILGARVVRLDGDAVAAVERDRVALARRRAADRRVRRRPVELAEAADVNAVPAVRDRSVARGVRADEVPLDRRVVDGRPEARIEVDPASACSRRSGCPRPAPEPPMTIPDAPVAVGRSRRRSRGRSSRSRVPRCRRRSCRSGCLAPSRP